MEITEEELIEKIAAILKPCWFGYEKYGLTEPPINNYPGQHLKYQAKAREQAKEIIALVRTGWRYANL